MGIFTGEYAHKLDAKNRVFVPRRLLEQIDDPNERKQFQIVRTDESCLTLFTDSGFIKHVRGIQSAQRTLPERRRVNRRAGAKAQPVPLDAQGRITLPDEFRAELKLGEDVVLVGCLDWIEIWDASAWNVEELPAADAFYRQQSGQFLAEPPPAEGA
jgi:MraZ protein